MTVFSLGERRPTLPEDGSAWIARSADVIGDARISTNVSVWFGAVIRADNTPIVIGKESNIQDGAILHSDPGFPLTVGEHVTVGHRAILHGCTIGDRVLIGMGAIVLNGAVIPNDCIIGAGALVTEMKTFPTGSLIVGTPASVRRALSQEEINNLMLSSDTYVKNCVVFSTSLSCMA